MIALENLARLGESECPLPDARNQKIADEKLGTCAKSTEKAHGDSDGLSGR